MHAARSWARFSTLCFVLAVALLVAVLTTRSGRAAAAGGDPATCPHPADIPANFDYPQSERTVRKWVSGADEARTRVHAWNLWAALNQSPTGQSPTGQPVWQSWCTETQAFGANTGPPGHGSGRMRAGGGRMIVAAGTDAEPERGSLPMRQFKLHNGLSSGSDPINFPVAPYYAVPAPVLRRYAGSGCVIPTQSGQPGPTLGNGPTLQNNGDVMLAGVVYNQSAFAWIRDNKLYDTATLSAMVPPANRARQMPAMPTGSIVLKPMMWPVPADGFVALPIWDDLTHDHDRYSGFEIQSQWPRGVAVTGNPRAQVAPASVSFLHGVTMNARPLGPNTYRNAPVVGVDQFYHYRPTLATMDVCDRALLDASAYYAYGRMFRQGDYLVLVAMHIMTKEQPAWTFQSVWWSDRPDSGPYAADRPRFAAGSVAGPWAHYLMTATYGIPASPDGKRWPVAYNPYIELAADHPIATNCMNCHLRAAWPASSDEYMAKGGPGALDVMSVDDPVMNGKIGVDRLWSISDRARAPRHK